MEQPEPIEGNLKNLIEEVKNNNSDIGFAFDGDGDRLGVIDENGNFQSASEVFLILSSHVLENKSSIKSIATTVSMTSNINEICKTYNSKALITKVGFKHLAPLLEEEKVSFAGEESGGYSMIKHVSDKDGILSALLYLEYLVKSKKSPSESISTIYDKFPKKQFERIDNKFSEVDRKKIQGKIKNLDTFIEKKYKITNKDFTDGKKFFIDNNSWILIRLSGTEPVFRIYIESPNKIILEEMKNQILEYFNN
jgi:phosphomannomutase